MFASAFDSTKPSKRIIAGSPTGHDARVLADIALRTHGKPVVHVALDDVRAAILADALAFFAPHIEVLHFPAWDCLPYDRVSPHTDVLAQRITTLNRLQQPFARPCLLLTTVNAIGQKTIASEILRAVSLSLAIGNELPVEKLRQFLAANGYAMASTVREAGEYAVRGGIVDLFPPGYESPVRLDFFGDEIESIRLFDPLSQTTTEKLQTLELLPISEVLLDERTIAEFRQRYRELFGTVTESDPLYEAVTAGQKFPGVEHWLSLFYPRLVSLLAYVPQSPVVFDWQADEAFTSRYQQITDFYQARLSLYQANRRTKKKGQAAAIYKPMPVDQLYIDPSVLEGELVSRAIARLSPFAAAETSAIDAGGVRGRDFAESHGRPEADLYDSLHKYTHEHQANGKHVAIACYSQGSADRIAGLLRTHGMNTLTTVKSWEEARKLDIKLIAFFIIGLEHGFVAPDLALITEQDILGDRLIRDRKSVV